MFVIRSYRWKYKTACTQDWHFQSNGYRRISWQRGTVARELADELRRKGLVVEGDNEGQIRLTDKGIVESRRIDCSERNRLEDWDTYQLQQ
jgi:hypothetical protein